MYDLKDIKRALQHSNEEIKRNDYIMSHEPDGTQKIKSLEGFLGAAIKKRYDKQRANQLEIFMPHGMKNKPQANMFSDNTAGAKTFGETMKSNFDGNPNTFITDT